MNQELERWQMREVCGMTLDDYDEEVNRRLRRRLWRAVGEVVGSLAVIAIVAALIWLCCAVSGYHFE